MDRKLKISVMGGEQFEINEGMRYCDLAENYSNRFKSPIMIAKTGSRLRELSSEITEEANIEFFDITDPEGMRVYQRSVSFLLVKAVKDVFGLGTDVRIEHSIKKNLYCELTDKSVKVTKGVLNKIELRMKELAKDDIVIKKEVFRRDDAVKKFKELGLSDKVKIFKYRRASNVSLYSIDGFYDYFYGYMVPTTGYINLFELTPAEKGFLVKLPTAETPEEIPEYTHPKKISAVFIEQAKWIRLMGVDNVADLNDIICRGEFGNLVRLNEALHENKIVGIANKIASKSDKIKVVLIAGPSSSGKTTFAQRLCIQLKVNGLSPHSISLDDYFLNREETPLDELGKPDFENVNALDLKLLNEHMEKLVKGERIEVPRFNFITGQREAKGSILQLREGDIIVIEGIHGLNDTLTSSISDENKFKIFISALSQLNVDRHNRISTSDSRLIRRLVRDYNFRGNDAAKTFDIWPKVVQGEVKNIFPFQENADAVFNSSTVYEICVLKQYIEPILFNVSPDMPEYVSAKRIIKFLDYFLGAGSENVPYNSILREFIGGSCFHV